MNSSALFIMILGCGIIWGGLIVTTAIALKKEKK
ncbi:methionine/alanine import family NSS transporter small subunit [Cetobacterium sp. 2A]|nr:methionine/alanine import family NSS transporter small subunit [Cetobacterium sp. 2A]MBC2855116.1 methionine/alanine import family NSS transporter small subunit [Cetobacterium sp. 2A]